MQAFCDSANFSSLPSSLSNDSDTLATRDVTDMSRSQCHSRDPKDDTICHRIKLPDSGCPAKSGLSKQISTRRSCPKCMPRCGLISFQRLAARPMLPCKGKLFVHGTGLSVFSPPPQHIEASSAANDSMLRTVLSHLFLHGKAWQSTCLVASCCLVRCPPSHPDSTAACNTEQVEHAVAMVTTSYAGHRPG